MSVRVPAPHPRHYVDPVFRNDGLGSEYFASFWITTHKIMLSLTIDGVSLRHCCCRSWLCRVRSRVQRNCSFVWRIWDLVIVSEDIGGNRWGISIFFWFPNKGMHRIPYRKKKYDMLYTSKRMYYYTFFYLMCIKYHIFFPSKIFLYYLFLEHVIKIVISINTLAHFVFIILLILIITNIIFQTSSIKDLD